MKILFTAALLMLPCLCLHGQEPDSLRYNLDGITVTAEKNQIVYKIDRRTVSGSTSVMAGGGTAMDILSGTSSFLVDADGNITFRGSSNFLVYIDGKPSPLEGTAALMQIPASSIEDIEIITTPSARYKTEGDTGIINVKTKGADGDGLSGTLTATGGTLGTKGVDGLLNYRSGDHLFYVGGTAENIMSRSDFKQDKTTMIDGYTTVSKSDGERYRDSRTYIGKAGYKYGEGRAHSFGVEFQAGKTSNHRGGIMTYGEDRSFDGTPISGGTFDARDHYILSKNLYQESMVYDWKIDDRTSLNVNSRLRYDSYSLEYTESNLFSLQGVRQEGTRGYEEEHHWDADGGLSISHDYSSTGSLEGGYQYTTYSEHGGYSFKSWDMAAQDFLWDDSQNIPFYYRRQVHALYAMLSDHPGNWEFEAGIRGEKVIDRMDIEMDDASRHYHRYDFFPSAHVSYKAGAAGSFTLGYSRRTNRPGVWKLEPYITYEDNYTRLTGNPDLLPEYIHSGEITYRNSIHGISLAVTGYCRFRTDVVDLIRLPYEPGITLDKIVNAGDQNEYGMEFSAVAKPWHWWSSTLNGNVFRYDFKAKLKDCTDNSGLSYMAGWINIFNAAKNTKIQFDSHLIGPRMLTQGNEKAYVYFDLAARQQFKDGRFVLSAVAHNVFHTAKYENFRNTPSLISHTIVTPKYPDIVVSLTWNFRSKAKEKSGAISSDALFEGKEF